MRLSLGDSARGLCLLRPPQDKYWIEKDGAHLYDPCAEPDSNPIARYFLLLLLLVTLSVYLHTHTLSVFVYVNGSLTFAEHSRGILLHKRCAVNECLMLT